MSAADPEIADAHRRLIDEGKIQTAFADPMPPVEPPEWLNAIGRFVIDLLKPVGEALVWLLSFLPDSGWLRVLAIAALLALAIVLLLGLAHWQANRIVTRSDADERDWQPEAEPARRWLEEAEALAREGKFAEAVHHLLFRSIADIEARRPDIVRPAATSRDIAAAPTLPDRARGFFGTITQAVERSLFAGRALDAGDWAEARAAYEHFALRSAWQAER